MYRARDNPSLAASDRDRRMTDNRTMTSYRRIASAIDIRRLERENRRILVAGFFVGVVVLGMFGLYLENRLPFGRSSMKPLEKPKSIPIKLVIRQPRSRTPYELKKPEPSEKPLRRMSPDTLTPGTLPETQSPQSFETPPERYDVGVEQLIDSIVNAPIPEKVYADVDPPRFTLPYVYDTLTIEKEPHREFSLRDELITLDDVDALGLYRGFAVVDPENKRNIKGYLHIPQYIEDMKFEPKRNYGLVSSVKGLGGAFHRTTGVDLKIENPVSLSSPYLDTFPVIYMTTITMEAFRLDQQAAKGLGDYLRKGGFAIIDNGRPWNSLSPAKVTLLGCITDALGKDVVFEPLDANDPVYHIFYSFGGRAPEGAEHWEDPEKKDAPEGAENWSEPNENSIVDYGSLPHDMGIDRLLKTIQKNPGTLFAVKINGRVAAIYSDKGYGHIWSDGKVKGRKKDAETNTRDIESINPVYKMGINMILFAMRQKGGTTKLISEYSHGTPGSK